MAGERLSFAGFFIESTPLIPPVTAKLVVGHLNGFSPENTSPERIPEIP